MVRSSWNFKSVAIVVLVALLAGAGLYFLGRWQANRAAVGERVTLQRQVQQTQAQLGQSQAQLAAAESRSRLLQARGTLYQAAVDLERRNFGTANTHLQSAARILATADATAARVDVQALDSVQRSLAATNLNVATDLQAQRARVLELAARLETLLPSEQGPPLVRN